jgi:hypothetical protein
MVVYVLCLNDFDFETSSGVKRRYFKKPASFFAEDLDVAFQYLFGSDFHRHHFGRNKHVVFESILRMREASTQAEIVARLTAERVWVLDLLDAFERRSRPPEEFAIDIYHPNARGHEVIAERLDKALLGE